MTRILVRRYAAGLAAAIGALAAAVSLSADTAPSVIFTDTKLKKRPKQLEESIGRPSCWTTLAPQAYAPEVHRVWRKHETRFRSTNSTSGKKRTTVQQIL